MVVVALLATLCASPGLAAQQRPVEVGPENGTLVIAGGGRLGPEIMERFVALAGGSNSRIVIIPTAGTRDRFPADWNGFQQLRDAGAGTLTVLHTRSPLEADDPSFVEPLRDATGVWLPGGRQWRLVDAYVGTRTHRELVSLLERGGVIGGTSAGASIQGSYLVRGAPEGNHIVMAPGYEEGFGLLRNVAVDQHLLARNRQDDLLQVLDAYPELLGIGLDEGTAVIVRGDTAEVVGRSSVAIYPGPVADGEPYYFVEAGMRVDLWRREIMR